MDDGVGRGPPPCASPSVVKSLSRHDAITWVAASNGSRRTSSLDNDDDDDDDDAAEEAQALRMEDAERMMAEAALSFSIPPSRVYLRALSIACISIHAHIELDIMMI